jgi:hypothetical protein
MNNKPLEFKPFIISLFIHLVLIILILFASYAHYRAVDTMTRENADLDVRIDTIVIADDHITLQAGSATDARRTNGAGGTGPHGLNDEAGRELVECARSGITVTPDNFLEYAKLWNLRKGLNPQRQKTILDRYPFLTGKGHFDLGSGRKLKSDFQECYEDVCAIIIIMEYPRQSLEEKSNYFTAAVQGYLDGTRPVRSWRTLWMEKKPAVLKDKIELVRLVRRLHNYSCDREDPGYEHMRKSLDLIVTIIPDELKFPVTGDK